MSASPNKPFTRSIERGKVPGGLQRGGSPQGFRDAGGDAFLSRLRRLEVVLLMVTGKLPDRGALDALLDKILELSDDTKDIDDGGQS